MADLASNALTIALALRCGGAHHPLWAAALGHVHAVWASGRRLPRSRKSAVVEAVRYRVDGMPARAWLVVWVRGSTTHVEQVDGPGGSRG